MKKILKRTLAVMLAVIMTVGAAPLAGFVGLELPSLSMLFATKAEAASYSGTCGDNATWTLDTETGILKISGTGTTYDYLTIATQTPWYQNRSYIQHVLISTGITGIGQENFGFCTNIQSVSIPNTVTKIGKNAFCGCTSLINVSIPDSVTSIGDAAFLNTAYYNTASYWDNGVLYINKHIVDTKSDVVSGDYQVKSGTLTIADNAFYQCKSLRSISIPSSVKSIGTDVFYECTSLEKVTITGNLANIPEYTFYGCSSLTEVTLPEGLTSIDNSAFYGCSLLADITLPNNLTSISDNAFYGCSSLCDIVIPDSVYSVSSSAFSNTGIYNEAENWYEEVLYIDDCLIVASNNFSGAHSVKEGTRLIAGFAFYNQPITDVDFPDSLKSIGSSAFYFCTSLSSVVIPSTVEYIGVGVFYYSGVKYAEIYNSTVGNVQFRGSDLTSVKLGEGTTKIGSGAFELTPLESIFIPAGVTEIDDTAFNSCYYLTDIVVENDNHNYSSKDGVLFNKDKATLIHYPAGNENTEYIIPSTVTRIENNAFHSFQNLTTLRVPDSVTYIGESAFGYSDKIIIDGIQDIYYCGTEEQMNAIEIKPYNELISDSTIHYNAHITTEGSEYSFSPTCTENGKIRKTTVCTICGNVVDEDITVLPALGHQEGEWKIIQKAGCLYYGSKELRCTRVNGGQICNHLIKTEQIEGRMHNWDSGEISQNPSCTEQGAVLYICQNTTETDEYDSCDERKLEYTDPLGHNEGEWKITKNPDCLNSGTKQLCCTRSTRIGTCGYVLDTETIPAIGHKWDNGAVTTKSTCKTQGVKTYTCQNDSSHKKTEALPLDTTNHTGGTYVKNASTANCLDSGYTGDTYCSGCNALLKKGETVAKLGHDMSGWTSNKNATHTRKCQRANGCTYSETVDCTFGEWVTIKEASCTVKGSKQRKCTVCGYTETAEIALKAHTAGTAVEENRVEATCTKDGKYEKVVYCSKCKTELSRETVTIPKTGHNWGDWTTVTAPTCEKAGSEKRVCKNDSSHVENNTLAAIGHKWDNGAVTTKSTCKTQGVKTYTCQNDSSHKKTEALPLDTTNHTGGTYVKNASTANCLDGGYTGDTYCSGCNALLKKGETVAKLGHDMSGWTSNKNATHTRKCQRANGCTYSETVDCTFGEWVTIKEASCTVKGSKQRKCTVCGYTETAEIALKAHTAGTAVEENRVEAACTKDGKYEKVVYCSKCKTELSRETVTIPKTGHNWGDWTTVTAPTCEKAGSEKRVCKNDSSHVENNTLAAIGHKWDNGVVTLEPTYDSTGIKTFTCQNDNSHIRTETIPANSRPSNENDNIIMDKTVDYDSLTGEAEIRLYASSKGQTIITNARTPLDIVLVLDQSGSMEGNLSAKLKTAATEFTNAIYEDAIKNDIDHRIAMVGFAMQNQYNFGDEYYQYLNTEILTTGGEPIGYNSLSSNKMNLAYKNALVSVNHNGFNPILTTAINNIEAKGATAADLGLDMACKIFSQNENDGTRKRIVVFMTDGVPTYKSDYMAETAENAQTKADLLKNTYDADLYSVGVLSGKGAEKARSFLNSIASVDSEGNAMYYDCSDADKLVEDFGKIATQSTTIVTDFTDITLIDTLSSAFTLTEIQEKNLRISAIKNLGIQNEDIIITRFSDGTTEIRIEHITPKEVAAGSEVNYVIDFKFKATANENALIEGSYSTNTDNAGVIVGISDVYENNFAVPNETVENAEGVIYFNVNGITYHIVRVHKGDTVTAPKFTLEGDYTFSGWDIPDEIIFDGGKLVVDSTLSQTEYTVTWNTDSGTVSDVYFAGDIIEIPSVGLNSSGEEFISWDSKVPTIMPGNNLEFTAIYGKHEHSYKEEILVAVSCGIEGKVKYVCSCGDNYTQTMHALKHDWTTSATVVGEGSTAYSNVYCINCGESPDETLSYTIKAKNGRKETTYDLKLVDSNNITIQPDGAITISLPIPENMLGARSISVYREEADGTLENLNGVRKGNYIEFTTDHFSNYVLKALFDNEDEVAGASVCVRNPSTTVICYGDAIILHADIEGELLDGYHIEWSASNGNFTYIESDDGITCTITPSKSGDTVFIATIFDADGNAISSDEQTMTSKAGFFQKIIAFFKKLFGLSKTIPQIYKNVF